MRNEVINQEEKLGFSLRIWKKIWPFISEYRLHLFLSLLVMTLSAAIDVVLPLFQRYLINNYLAANTTEGIAWFAIVYFLAIAAQSLIVIIFFRLGMHIDVMMARDMRRVAFRHTQQLSFSYYNTTPVGYMVARVMSDTSRITETISWGLVDMSWAVLYIIGSFIPMLLIDWKLALVIFTIVPIIVVVSVYFQRKLLRENRNIRKINSKITGAFNEGISGAKTSKTLVIEDQNSEQFNGIAREMYVANRKYNTAAAIYGPLITLIGSFAVAIILFYGSNSALDGLMDIGDLSLFVNYALGMVHPIMSISRVFTDLVANQANIERVTTLLETKPEIVDSPEVVEKYGDVFAPKRENWEPLVGEIEFEDVSFRYPDGNEYVLEHFNLKIPAGSTVALVGETGAGKSTLVNLACRFYEPTSGRILIDGKDYRDRAQIWLHSNIGYVLQTPHLFSGTIRDNIRYGKLDATDEEIERAAKIVSADKIIAKLDNGFDSDVGESGDRLSTGEKQLISFARAVLANPAIFVLDEATSSIDTETEKMIQDAIEFLLKDRTSILIAHRLSTIKNADLILVVRDGKIIERGTHDELIAQGTYYYSLYTKQFELENSATVFEEKKKA